MSDHKPEPPPEMVARVAKAIYAKCNELLAAKDETLWLHEGEMADVARVAIAAMQEPTEAMIHACEQTET